MKRIISTDRLGLYAWLSLATQILIVVTGGAVRLTGSGLGCPTWPKCTEDSFVTVPEMGWHGVIEFGNRLLTFVLIIVALLTFIVVRRLSKQRRYGLTWPALALGLGIIAQALLGGVTVLTGLNPWVVGAHFVLSGVLIAIASLLLFRVRLLLGRIVAAPTSSPLAGRLAWPTYAVSWITVLVGVLVTGAGPHAGDAETPRNNLDLEIWQHFHSYPGYLFVALLVFQLLVLRRQINASAPLQSPSGETPQQRQAAERLTARSGTRYAHRITLITLSVSLLQAAVGVIQARTGVPALLVGIHMFGAAALIALSTYLLLVLRSPWARRIEGRSEPVRVREEVHQP